MQYLNNTWLIEDIKFLYLQELRKLKELYTNTKKFDKAEETQDKIKNFNWFCSWANDEDVLKEVNHRLTDFYQIIEGYYYTIAEDFESNPLIKIDRLKKAVVSCSMLKNKVKEAQIYSNKYICQQNRNYLR